MTTKKDKGNGPKKKGLIKKLLVWTALLLLLIAVVVFVALLTGIPQNKAVEYALQKGLGTKVSVQSVGISPTFDISSLSIFDNDEADTPDKATIQIDGFVIDYKISDNGGRYLNSLDIESFEINADGTNAENPNYDFVLQLLAAPSSDVDPTPFLPRKVNISNIKTKLALPNVEMQLNGINVQADVNSLDDLSLKIVGAALEGNCKVDALGKDFNLDGGTVDVDLSWKDKKLLLSPLRARLPGMLEVDVLADITLDEPAIQADVVIDKMIIQGGAVSQILADMLPIPVAFSMADLSGTKIKAALQGSDYSLTDSSLNIKLESLVVGEAGHELYEGDISVLGNTDPDDPAVFHIEGTFNRGQKITATVRASPEEIRIKTSLQNWSRESILAVTPKDYRSFLDMAPTLANVAFSEESVWKDPEYEVNASLGAMLMSKDRIGRLLVVKVKGSGSTDTTSPKLFEGNVGVSLGKPTVSGDLDIRTAADFNANFDIREIDPDFWARTIAGIEDLGIVKTIVNGTLALNSVGTEGSVQVKPELSLDGMAYADLGIALKDRISLTGDATLSPTYDSATGDALSLKVGKRASLDLKNWSVGLEPLTAEFDLASTIDLQLPAEMFSIEGLQGKVDIDASVKHGSDKADIDFNILSNSLSFAGVSVSEDSPLKAKGSVSYDMASGKARSAGFDLSLGENISVKLSDLSVDIETFEAEVQVAVVVELDAVAELLAMEDLRGKMEVQASVESAGDIVNTEFKATAMNVGYGDLMTPYGVPVNIQGAVQYMMEDGKVKTQEIKVSVGDDATFTCGPLIANLDPLAISNAPFKLAAKLQVLADMGYLDTAEGSADMSGTLSFADDAVSAEADFKLRANSIVLPDNLAALGGVSIDAKIKQADVLSANASLHVVESSVAGVSLRDLDGKLVFEKDTVKADNLEAKLFGGSILVNAEIGLLQEGLPIKVSVDLRGLDLDIFTKEFAPPDVTLTGLASGKVSALLKDADLKGLMVSLVSDEDFSMNRSMVEQLLLTQYVAGGTSGKRVAKMISQLIGKDDQRPFDSAEINLGLEGERITGEAILKSENLNLTISLLIDKQALFAALELHQELNLENIANISTKPVQ